MSVWIGAHQVAADAANAIRRSVAGMEVQQGDFLAPEPLEQIVTTLGHSADALADYPWTGEYVAQIREIAHRLGTCGRAMTGEPWKADHDVVHAIENEMFQRLMRESKGERAT